ncbi:MAG: hypothetical protein K0R39_3277, partial [Symbiobacteriaceae bacterium]|nr:hypothetical protein [Symbiobacteriaceae bacterium]
YRTGKVQALVQKLLAVDGAFDPKDQISIGIFSKTDESRGIKSPLWVYRGTVAQLRAAWPQLKPIGAWTDLVGTLDAGVEEVKKHKGPQTLWLLTDNIDQQDANVDSAKATNDWYNSLAARADLFRMYIFPIDVQEEKRGLVLYAMARNRGDRYVTEDAAQLDKAVAAINGSALKNQLGEGGFLVRPLADEGLTVEVTGFTPDPEVSPDVSFAYDQPTGAISLTGFAEKKPIRGQFKVVLTSRFPALKIVDAKVEAELVDVASPMFVMPTIVSQKITPNRVTLAPGQKAEYTVDLDIEPPFMLWNPFEDPLAALEEEGAITGQLKLRVYDVTFEATQPGKYYKVAQIPEILGNRSKVPISVVAPLTMQVGLGWERLLQLGLYLFLLIAVLVIGYWALFGQKRMVRIYNDAFDKTEPISLKRRLDLPDMGYIRMKLFGGVVFVPTVGKVRKERPLRGRSGRIDLEDGRSFFYDMHPGRAKSRSGKGGRNRASAGGLY